MKYAAVKRPGYVRRFLTPVGCILGMAYCCYHTFYGQFGLTALPTYKDHKAEMVAEADELARSIKYLENRLALLDQNALDTDLAEELIRSELGYAAPDEILIPLP